MKLSKKCSLLLIALLIFAIGGCTPLEQAANEHGHEHGETPYEWSAVYGLAEGDYTLQFQESEHDPSILIAFLKEDPDEEALLHLAQHVMEGEAEEIAPGEHFYAEDQYAYNLLLNPEGTTFTFTIDDPGRYVIFTEHFAWEFDMKVLCADGNEIIGENPTDHAEPHEH